MDLIDNNGNTILYIVNKQKNDMFNKLLDIYVNNTNKASNILDVINNNNNTLLTYCINNTLINNDLYHNRIIKLLEYGINPNIPKYNPPLCMAIENKKKHIIKNLIDGGCDVNIKNYLYITPLLLAIYYKDYDIVKYLLEKNADINYMGAEGDQNSMILSLERNDNKMVDILLNSGFDVKKYNRKIQTPLHIAFIKKNSLLPHHISKLIYYGDMMKQDIYGKTPLHYFLSNYNWKNYSVVLESKMLDIFANDNTNKAPINYINNNEISQFINMIAEGYFNKLRNMSNSNNSNSKYNNIKNRCNSDTIKHNECINIIKRHILKTSKSYLDIVDNQYINNKINMVVGVYSDIGKFNTNTMHSILYTLYILKKYKNLCVPYQYYIHDKVLTEASLHRNVSIISSIKEQIILDLIKIYTEYLYEMLPSIIIWKDSNNYHIYKDIEYYLQRCLNTDSIRFIFFKITMVISENGTHANGLIFDKKMGILERFEPYGDVPYMDSDLLDDLINKKIGKYFKIYLKKHNKKYTYLVPKIYINNVSFQTISNDGDITNRKLGDPAGYCLAWVFWYLEMRLKNPDVHPEKLIKKAIIKINNSRKNSESNFIDFIRYYANYLDKQKNKILEDSGIDKKYFYKLVLNKQDHIKLLKNIAISFNEIIDNYTTTATSARLQIATRL